MLSLRLTLLTLLSIATRMHAQCPSNKWQWDLAVSYAPVATALSTGDNRVISTPAAPTFFTIRYFFYNRLALGATAGINAEKGTLNDASGPAATYSANATTVAAEVYYIYYFRKYIELYTMAGAGPSFTTTETHNVAGASFQSASTATDKLKGQYTPVGIRLGGRIGCFAEVGYGYKGIINTGLSVKLGPSSWWRNGYR